MLPSHYTTSDTTNDLIMIKIYNPYGNHVFTFIRKISNFSSFRPFKFNNLNLIILTLEPSRLRDGSSTSNESENANTIYMDI